MPTPASGISAVICRFTCRDVILQDCKPGIDCQLVFGGLPTEVAGPIEQAFAAAGYIVCSNSSNHRYDADVPLMIPEVNPDHLQLIEVQKRKRGWSGCIITNPNCSTTHLVSALHPLHTRFGVKKLFVVTMQAVSDAGYPGVSSMDILDNVVPYIGGEEAKMEQKEPQKLLGHFDGNAVQYADFVVSALSTMEYHAQWTSVGSQCRVCQGGDARRGIECLAKLRPAAPADEIARPRQPALLYDDRQDRPQPRLDRLKGTVPGMATVIGRLRPTRSFTGNSWRWATIRFVAPPAAAC